MGRLHRTGSAARNHQLALLGQDLARHHHLPVALVGPLQEMAAHDADHVVGVVAGQEILERIAHGVVVEGAGNRDAQVCALLAPLEVIGIHPRVETAAEGLRPRRVEALVEALRVVERIVEDVVDHAHPRQDQVRAEALLHPGDEIAAHEHAVHEIHLFRVFRNQVEVDVLEGVVDHQLGPDRRRGQVLDPADVDVGVVFHFSVAILTPRPASVRRTCAGFSKRIARMPTASAPATFFGTSSMKTHSSRSSP